jgi:hypothetical protein
LIMHYLSSTIYDLSQITRHEWLMTRPAANITSPMRLLTRQIVRRWRLLSRFTPVY